MVDKIKEETLMMVEACDDVQLLDKICRMLWANIDREILPNYVESGDFEKWQRKKKN